MWKVREIADKVTNVVMNYTDIEAKVREATNDDSWGPTGTIRHELSTATFSYDQFPEVMGMLWKRIAENKRNPRRIYKSLLLLHHLLLNGSDRVVRATQDRMYELRSLQDYHIVYEPGFNLASIMPVSEYKDGEVNVRVKAKEIVDLVQDEDKLKEDRKKSKKNRDKYVGIGSDRMMNRWNNGGDYGDDDFKSDFKSDSYYKSSGDSFKSERDRDRDEDEGSTSPSTSSSRKFESSGGANSWSKPSTRKEQTNQDTDDFNPRAGESQETEFGSFKASSEAKPGVSTLASPSSVPKSDFADFQSAFSAGRPPIPNAAAPSSFDLLGLDDQHQPAAVPVPSPQQYNSPAFVLQPPPGQGPVKNFQQQQSTMAQQVPNVQLLQQQQLPPQPQLFDTNISAANSIPSTTFSTDLNSVQLQQVFFQQPPLPNAQFQQHSFVQSQSQSDSLLFDQPSFGGDTLLQPISTQSTQANNNLNNNNNTSSSKNAAGVNLKGTTWSDLNISIDDLNLSKSKPKATPQPSINQLQQHSPTKSFHK